MSQHVVVWLDHQEARVVTVSPAGFDESSVHSPASHIHHHPKGGTEAHEHPDDAKRFFHEIAQALASAEEVLVVGPSTAKLHFVKYVHKHAHALEPKIVGVETVDHPSDGQLAAYARKYFLAADRKR